MALNQAWLDQVREEILEPDLPICDPHHHLWDFRTEHVEPQYFLPEVLADVSSGHNVVSTVFVECRAMYRAAGEVALRPVGETEFVNGIAAMSASGGYGEVRIAHGIVGHANLALGGEVAPILEAHIRAGGGRFRGIRDAAASDPHPEIQGSRPNPPHRLLDERFQAGFQHLARYDLSFEAWLYHHQIPDVIDLAHRFPETVIILNHLGGPLGIGPYAERRGEIFDQWRRDLTELARCPQVVVKLGGINMPVNGYGWHQRPSPPTSLELADATRPWYEFAMERFGVERCMFESNFPVDKRSVSYPVLWNSFKRLAAGCTADEKAALFHDTAARVYRLDA